MFKYNHWCLSVRHQASMSELDQRDVGQGEKPSKESRIDPFVDGAVEVLDSTVDELTATNVGFLPAKSCAARRRISAVASGSNVADTFQASIRREKLSMTARR